MANGNPDYTIGGLVKEVANNKNNIEKIEKNMKELKKIAEKQQSFIDKTTGSVNTIKYIAFFMASSAIANIVITIVF
jgi:t-SNARE complex subunit (syntaxin)